MAINDAEIVQGVHADHSSRLIMLRELLLALVLCASVACDASAMPIAISGGKKVDVHASAAQGPDGRLVVVFESTVLGVIGLHRSQSTDGGASWSTPQQLWPQPQFVGREHYSHPALVWRNGSYLLVYYDRWQQAGGIGHRIGLARSTDGISFTEDAGGLDLGWSDGSETHPHLNAEADGSLTLVYQRGNSAFLARSDDGGQSWDQTRTLIAEDALKPRISRRSDGEYLLIWQNPAGNMLLARTSSDPFQWKATPVVLVAGTACREGTPLALADGSAMVFYAARVADDFDIYSRSRSSTGVWSPPLLQIRQNPPGVDDFQPTPLLTAGGLRLFWSHGRAPPTLGYTHVYTQVISDTAIHADGFETGVR